MVNPDPPATSPFWQGLAPVFWHQLTRLGEAQLLLPALLLATVWLLRRPGGARLALVWLGTTAAAATLTTASKVAFIGFGIGYAPLDFTGISGHAMFAAAVLPPLVLLAGAAGAGGAAVGDGGSRRRHLLLAGYGLAGLVAVSRVMVGAHSWSEVVAGAALGALCSGAALAGAHIPAVRLARWVPLALAAWGVVAVAAAPPSTTHDLVTRLALAQSGRAQPFYRADLHRAHRLRVPAGGLAPGVGPGSLQPR
jgi:membrane-associated phospholipid phosphatase